MHAHQLDHDHHPHRHAGGPRRGVDDDASRDCVRAMWAAAGALPRMRRRLRGDVNARTDAARSTINTDINIARRDHHQRRFAWGHCHCASLTRSIHHQPAGYPHVHHAADITPSRTVHHATDNTPSRTQAGSHGPGHALRAGVRGGRVRGMRHPSVLGG
eukprot:131982-Rhodomonas_salina.1